MEVMEDSLTAIFAAHIDFCLINDKRRNEQPSIRDF